MCGIVGICNWNGQPVSEKTLRDMASLVNHRGPDDEGLWLGGNIGLGHKRLSIIDLTATGHQPMANENESVWIVYNGEIYNYVELRSILEKKGHTFRSQSDTEVILHSYEEWGEECVHKFNGMFAFAIWDDIHKTLFAARDRLGIKPFYFYVDNHRIIFSSEIKAIFRAPNVPILANYSAILDYMAYEYVLSDDTFFKGVRKLLPGHRLSVKGKHMSIQRYWELPSPIAQEAQKIDFNDLKTQINALFTDSVRIRLRSDVEVGCYLSGGIDSSAITCHAAMHAKNPLKTFTGKFSESPAFDETYYAKAVSRNAKTDYHELNIGLDKALDSLPEIIWQMDEPAAGPGMIPQYFISRLASQHVKVVLGGQGGDELFGGYGWYGKVIFALLLRQPHLARNMFQSLSAKAFLLDYAKKEGILRVLEGIVRFGFTTKTTEIYRNARSIMSNNDFCSLIHQDILSSEKINVEHNFVRAFDECNGQNILSQIFRFDLLYYLQALLHVEDRTSMAFSLESRVPILDHRLVELASAIPPDYKFAGDYSKFIFRESVKNSIPKEVYARKDKQGFPTPVEFWFRDQRNRFVQDYLITNTSASSEIFNRGQLIFIYHSLLNGNNKAAQRLWRCLCVAIWYDNFLRNYSSRCKTSTS
ncbi:MAG: asparagine synthase (glutamine-hydrolyzing) [Candidatus Hodarchaeota archaeon]